MKRADRFLAVDCEAVEWRSLGIAGTEGIRNRPLVEGGPDMPSVSVTGYDPDWVVNRHRHIEDEILILSQGQVELEGATHTAPAVLFVGVGTLYGPIKAGPQGAQLVRVASRRLRLEEPTEPDADAGKRLDRYIAVDCETLEYKTHEREHMKGPQGLSYRTVFQGGADLPAVHMTRYAPGWVEPRHRHAEDEVLTVIEGDLTIDGVTHAAPSVLYVGRGTLYGPLTAGADGAKFIRVAAEALKMDHPANMEAESVY